MSPYDDIMVRLDVLEKRCSRCRQILEILKANLIIYSASIGDHENLLNTLETDIQMILADTERNKPD